MKIILGSGSKFRKEIMAMAGYDFDVMVPNVDERAIRSEDPYALPLLLAQAKATALVPQITEPALLITSDTIVICAGKVYEKPANENEVISFLHDYIAAKSAEAITTVLVTNTATGKSVNGTEKCLVEFKRIPEDAVEKFLATGDPYSRAGGFSIENADLAPYITLFKGTRDGFMGMPLWLLSELLAKASI